MPRGSKTVFNFFICAKSARSGPQTASDDFHFAGHHGIVEFPPNSEQAAAIRAVAPEILLRESSLASGGSTAK
jgi:hypothetical protein